MIFIAEQCAPVVTQGFVPKSQTRNTSVFYSNVDFTFNSRENQTTCKTELSKYPWLFEKGNTWGTLKES